MNRQHRRAFFHNYRLPAIYHITIVKHAGIESFSTVSPDERIELCGLGKVIVFELFEFFKKHEAIKLYQYVIMPDHIHLLLRVTEPLEEHLGYYIGNLTGAISRHWRDKCGHEFRSVFEEGYNDRIVGASRSLDVIFKYIKDNPHRLAVRRVHPEWFHRVNRLKIGDVYCQAYGNLFLLRSPFKEQVVVHRADSEAVREARRERWLHTAANGGVLVSPFISPAEKAVRAEAENAGGKIILITHEPMPERYKPAEHDFAICEEGRMLIISTACGGGLLRSTCLAMNALAEEICASF